MVLLTPCIDYVITFTELAGGDAEQITAATPALMLTQLLLLPVYLWLFMGEQVGGVHRGRAVHRGVRHHHCAPADARVGDRILGGAVHSRRPVAGDDGLVAGPDDGRNTVRRDRLPTAARTGFDRTDRIGCACLCSVPGHSCRCSVGWWPASWGWRPARAGRSCSRP